MKEKATSITAQRERKAEAGANVISTFICHASEQLETSLAPELRLPAASPWPGELLGATRALDPLEGTSWCVATCMRGGGQVPVPQPRSPSPCTKPASSEGSVCQSVTPPASQGVPQSSWAPAPVSVEVQQCSLVPKWRKVTNGVCSTCPHASAGSSSPFLACLCFPAPAAPLSAHAS